MVVRDSFSTQTLDRLRGDAQMDLLFIGREEVIRDRINNGNIGYSDHEIVELKILR